MARLLRKTSTLAWRMALVAAGLALAALPVLVVLRPVLAALPAAHTSDPGASPYTQILTLGGQQIDYRGALALEVEPFAYWDTPPAAADVIAAVDDAGLHLSLAPGPDDAVRLIVQLEDGPIALSQDRPGLHYRANLRRAQDRVLQALASQDISVHVRQRFAYVYSGLAVVARAGDREAIAQTPGVRAVYPDLTLQPLLSQSVPLVGAPAVWAMHDGDGRPVTGSGVRVAVIDSGIDYHHPDLGGAGFPNPRVITGYNFISDTLDPWDDLGHGTHVAGIVGAAGGVTGMAPDASLMVYKIFDAQGQSTTSDVIAAIERALDPDGDPGTDDGAQVLNLSLGSAGYAGDPLSHACDNAVQAGAVVVVAAGNSGPRYQSIASPGLARRAISVGATGKSDGLWPHSSRGPVPGSWDIKPDLLAPGVSITSTFPGGGYMSGSGTSLAAPHAAGAAALLRQLHPTWPPEWVRAALMNTARDLGYSPYVQGAGRLRADRAAATPALLLPPSLSLGRVDGAQAVWVRSEPLSVQNVSSATLTYTLSVAGSFPAGVTVTLGLTRVVIPAGGAAGLTLTVAVDTARVPDRPADPFAYWGALDAAPSAGAVPSLRVPFAFVKAPLLRLHVDEVPAGVMFIHDDPLTSRYVSPVTTTSDHLLPAATYNVAVQYPQPYAYVVQTAVLSASGFVELSLPRSAAIHQARIAFTDEAGETAAPDHALHRFMWGGNGWLVSELASSGAVSEIVRFSDVPPQFTWERTAACTDPAGVYRQWHGRAQGIGSDLTFLTGPADLAWVDHPLRALPGASAYTVYELLGHESTSYAYAVGPPASTVALPYLRRAYYRTPPSGHALYAVRAAVPSPAGAASAGGTTSPWLQLDTERYLLWRHPFSPLSFYWRVPAGGAEPLRLGPPHSFVRFANVASDTLRLVAAEGRGMYYRAYQGGDVAWDTQQPYQLWQDGVLVQSGEIGTYNGRDGVSIGLPAPGVYSLTLPFTYTLGDRDPLSATGRLTARFDTTRCATDADPPFVKVLRLLEGGRPVDVASGPVELQAVVTDTGGSPPAVNVAVNVAYDVGAGWVTVAVTRVGDLYTAHLPGFADGAAVRLRLSAVDAAGNAAVHELEPAYRVRLRRVYLPCVIRGL